VAFDIFLVFQRGDSTTPIVQGETTDSYFTSSNFSGAGIVEIADFSFGIHNTVTLGSATGGAGTGKAQFNEFKVTKSVDKSSPTLFKAVGTGVHFPAVQLYLRKAGAGDPSTVYLAYEFQVVFVSEIDWSGSSGDDTPSEVVTFVYGALDIAYHAQNTDGTLAPAIKSTWNQITNTTTLQSPASLVGF
jgi:type VI secretion system secreted protein Hcp